MMNKTTTGPADLHRVIAEALGGVLERDLGDIGPETMLFDELGLDSTGVLDLVLRLEELLGVGLDTDELEVDHFATIGNLAGFLELMLGERE
jgi:acyl carrier protein